MDVFNLSRNWFDWSFENPEKIKPNHTALYFFCIEHCNRLGWKQKFGLPTTMAKEAIGIKSYNTYVQTLNDLVMWGFIKMIEKSKNQYSSNIIALSNFNKAHDKALDKALIKHGTKQEESTEQSIDSIDIQETNKQINKQTNIQKTAIEIFDDFRKSYPGVKRGNETEFENFKKKHKDWTTVLPLLKNSILRQISDRDVKIKNKQFTPEWKNLQTWINQRCWEEGVESTSIKPEELIIGEIYVWKLHTNSLTIHQTSKEEYEQAVAKKTEHDAPICLLYKKPNDGTKRI